MTITVWVVYLHLLNSKVEAAASKTKELE